MEHPPVKRPSSQPWPCRKYCAPERLRRFPRVGAQGGATGITPVRFLVGQSDSGKLPFAECCCGPSCASYSYSPVLCTCMGSERGSRSRCPLSADAADPRELHRGTHLPSVRIIRARQANLPPARRAPRKMVREQDPGVRPSKAILPSERISLFGNGCDQSTLR